jgi:hypothetical protein
MSKFIKMKLAEARAKFEQIDEISDKTVASAKAGAEKWLKNKDRMGHPDDSYIKHQTPRYERQLKTFSKRLAKEEAEELHEVGDTPAGKKALGSYVKKATSSAIQHGVKHGEKKAERDEMDRNMNRHMSFSDKDKIHGIMKTTHDDVHKPREKALRRYQGILRATDRITKEETEELHEADRGEPYRIAAEEAKSKGDMSGYHKNMERYHDHKEQVASSNYGFRSSLAKSHAAKASMHRAAWKAAMNEETEGCMLDTSMGGADQIAQSKTGEVYKKSSKQTTGPSPATGTSTHIVAGKTGEALNATGITKRVPAVESAVLDVMAKTFEKRKMFEDASNIAIISPEQRLDWLEVSKGNMDVVDYFNKYKV